MKGAAIAAAIGGAVVGFLYLAVRYGIDLGYRMYDKHQRQQAALKENLR